MQEDCGHKFYDYDSQDAFQNKKTSLNVCVVLLKITVLRNYNLQRLGEFYVYSAATATCSVHNCNNTVF